MAGKPQLEQKDPEETFSLSEYEDWAEHPFTKKFLGELERLEKAALQIAVNNAESLSDPRILNKHLHRAAALRKVIDYGRSGRNSE